MVFHLIHAGYWVGLYSSVLGTATTPVIPV
jgi:hypothetical protein